MTRVRIAALRRLATRPPTWGVTLAGSDREFEVSTRALMSGDAFRRRALIAVAVRLPRLGNQEWLRIVGTAMRRVVVVEPEGAS
jgi:hypothetical protein